MNEIQKRGKLTQRIKDKSQELLGYEIDTLELRLMPYIHYVMTNEQRIDINKISGDERKILKKWEDAGYIKLNSFDLTISYEFWNILTEIIFLGYVDVE